MSEFQLFLGLGKDHILDYQNGYDHILFVVSLCAIYQVRDWKKVLVLITAFTIGHSVTLALATWRLVEFRNDVIEFLIPLTILITCLSNIFMKEGSLNRGTVSINYAFALVFGLIHGLGFSNYLREVLGRKESIASPLLAFNLGLELGQIIVVALFMMLTLILVDFFGASRRDWRLVLSSAIGGIALILIKDSELLS